MPDRLPAEPDGAPGGRGGPWATLVLAVLAYLPPFTSHPGLVAADTKQYLYLDPWRLTIRAASMWDPGSGLGTVTHQNIGYLFPMGPWFSAVHALGIPMWVGQRAWMGSLLFAAGTGVLWCSRRLGLSGPGPLVAAVAYTATPFIIDYIARISAILMPWAALGWMLGLTVLAARRGGWRYPALFALVVALVGGVNATSILLVGLGPVIWLGYAVWVTGEVSLSRAWAAAWRIALLSLAVSLWWIAGLWAEGSYGLAILQYTETVRTVARTSLVSEALRGLGYWFFYGQDKVQPWTAAALPYMQALWLLAVSFCVPAAAMALGLLARWRYRAFAISLVAVGAVAAVGTYPYQKPSPLGAALEAASSGSSVGLAMRSSNRVLPLTVLGFALLMGAGISAVYERRPAIGRVAALAAAALVLIDMPPLWDGGLVATNLARPESIPAYWPAAARYLDGRGGDTRVLGLPGEDFAAYRWGVTEDPIPPGLLTRPYVARQVVPQGEPASVDLMAALDGSIQNQVFDPRSVASIARLISAGDVVIQNDLQYERYALPQPRALWRQLDPAPAGTRLVARFGPSGPTPVIRFPLVDETSLGLPDGTRYPPALAVLTVTGARPITRAESATDPLVLAGNGEGLVAAADAGLLGRDPTVFYSGSFAHDRRSLERLLAQGATLVVTDSNGAQGHRWGGLQDNLGYVEAPDERPLEPDPSDARLPLFPGAPEGARTTARLMGVASVRATRYGNPVTFTPEDRPANALDGDPRTAWTVGAFSDPVGERLEIRLRHPVTTDHLVLLQPTLGHPNRHITRLGVDFDGGGDTPVALGASSRAGSGQVLHFPRRRFSRLDLTVEAVDRNGGRNKDLDGLSGVGLAEVGIPGVNLAEVIDLPTDLLGGAGASSSTHELVLLMTRQRAPDTPPRKDPQLAIKRSFVLPTARSFSVGGEARISAQDSDALVDADVGAPGPRSPVAGNDAVLWANSSTRLPGDRYARADATLDADPTTSWVAALTPQAGEWLEYGLARPLRFDHLDLRVVDDGRHSLPTRMTVQAGNHIRTILLPPLPPGRGRPQGATRSVTLRFPALVGDDVKITIDGVETLTTLDYYGGSSGARDVLPVALAEVGLPGVTLAPPPAVVPSPCRSDLVRIDGRPVDLRVAGSTADALAGRPLSLLLCGRSRTGLELGPGRHFLETAPRLPSGWELDRLWLASAPGGGPLDLAAQGRLPAVAGGGRPPQVRIRSSDPTTQTLSVGAASRSTPGYWMVLGQSLSRGWTASARSTSGPTVSLGPARLIDGYANGWFVPAALARHPLSVRLTWAPQRVVWLALVASLAGLLICAALALLARRRGEPGDVVVSPGPGDRPTLVGRLVHHGPPVPWRAALPTIVVFGLGASLVSSPWALLLLVPLAWALRHRRAPRLGLAAVGLMLLTGAYMVAGQWAHRYLPDINWPANFGPAHTLGWSALLVLVADALVEARRSRSA